MALMMTFRMLDAVFYGKSGEPREDIWGEVYLCLANYLVHDLVNGAMTIAGRIFGNARFDLSAKRGRPGI